eukprot:TRINITY_DN1362_c0_g1_i1.p1 TRINITY_DN1362_c0_g1~~TRINITY_DN1362_c0_g1_i1.p1  ORF type:complete len:270 (+),score=35.74 TRINITY_DN1362_c0_g1_i1:108-917(+)
MDKFLSSPEVKQDVLDTFFLHTSPNKLQFSPELGSFYVPVVSVLLYWMTLYVIKQVMKNRKPFELKYISLVHNFNMTVLSLVMAVAFGYHAIRIFLIYGGMAAYCGTFTAEDNKLGFWCNIFYLSKFYEFVDTIILVLRKKEPGTLHIVHHTITGLISWIAINSEIMMGWITAFNNSLVHVFMYYYYFMQTLKVRVWWKKYLTTAQIIQFVIDCATSIPFIYFRYQGYDCRGTVTAWILANISGFTLLSLFVQFFTNTYNVASSRAKDE